MCPGSRRSEREAQNRLTFGNRKPPPVEPIVNFPQKFHLHLKNYPFGWGVFFPAVVYFAVKKYQQAKRTNSKGGKQMPTSRKLKSALVALFVAAAFLTAGCSLFDTLESDSSGSVTFRIDGETAEILRHAQNDKSRHAELVSASRSLSAEDVSTGSTTDGLYFDIALKGGYTASQTLPVTDGATALPHIRLRQSRVRWRKSTQAGAATRRAFPTATV